MEILRVFGELSHVDCQSVFGSSKFFQCSTGYMPSAVYVLTNTIKILPNTRGDLLQINFPQNDEKHNKSTLMEILQVFRTTSHVDCKSVFWNGAFYRKVLRSFEQSVISEIYELQPSYFFSKCLKFDVDFRNGKKHWENVLRFLGNCICIESYKFSKTSTGYLPSAVNVLRNTPKILAKTRGDNFQIKFSQKY